MNIRYILYMNLIFGKIIFHKVGIYTFYKFRETSKNQNLDFFLMKF